MKNIKISIITVVRNDLIGLQRTFRSIESSLTEEVEWIIVDGMSKDGTQDFLQKLKINSLKWVSEKDKNMYDAMNKGIKLSTGEYLLFLNAGDILEISMQESFLRHQHTADLVFYNIRKLNPDGSLINWTLPPDFLDHLKDYPSVPHQSTFIKNSVFERFGYYSEEYKYLGDYEFFSRIIVNNSAQLGISYFLDTILTSFICDGVTFNYKLSLKLMRECISIQKHFFHKISYTTASMYWAKYIISVFPNSANIVNKMRKYLRR